MEFDWIFNTSHGSKLIEILALTKNINLFSIPVIQDCILFQWKFFKYDIIFKTLVPFLIYFACFVVYVSYTMAAVREGNSAWVIPNFIFKLVSVVIIAYFILIKVI